MRKLKEKKMRSKTDVKREVQKMICEQIANIFYSINEDDSLNDAEKESFTKSADEQFARIEGLFGYEKNSWARG
jgi:hypothetical protein